ncbi:MAG: hypothetical protein DBX05_03895 [Candidatus Poseidoniales archaeon]|nr:MAG: hypothetical protein CBE15_07000 [Euryarchaeota archaeon TMED255]RAH11516.1 MAG: hypothetical protein CMA23_002075 [Euryarchaeota archaeon]RCH73664.1 MAG: hypothetical protein DBX05_03895 [Candidatus Poseidoniales archaeon]
MLDRLMDDLVERAEVSWCTLVGDDGVPVRTRPGILATPEVAAALVESAMARAEEHLDGARLTRMSMLADQGITVLVRVNDNHVLIVSGTDSREHGTLRSVASEVANRMNPLLASELSRTTVQ